MARLTRSFVDNGCYHIITRGNQKQTIFMETEDFLRYLGILKRAKKKYTIMLYAYCLMSNHVHLLIEAVSAHHISKFMHWINRGYAAYFNTKYEKVGHLWQGRFRSKPILKGQYLIHCANYIEANPIRANIATDISEYDWNSYKERCLLRRKYLLNEVLIESTKETAGLPASALWRGQV